MSRYHPYLARLAQPADVFTMIPLIAVPYSGAIEVELTDSTSSGRWRWIWPQPERDGWLASLPKNDMLKDVAV
eukprot:scaffold205446_cov45-Tisochrysis_lutea.AAC.2